MPPDERPLRPLLHVGELVAETWEVRGLIGVGGMGQVFDAYDRFLRRAVAIKASPGGESGPGLRAEAQALAAIRHPSLVTVYAGGVHRGLEYVVMERIFGEDLGSHLARLLREGTATSIVDALAILAPLADALGAVHRAGIAHRDVKPENVLLGPNGRVVLADFGVFQPEFEVARSPTRSGSPAYMAPETIRGSVELGGGYLVDVYAFGILAFELLAGRLPFTGDNTPDYYLAHLTREIPSVRALRRDVPLSLEALVVRCLAKDPDDRPQSMDDVAFQLRALLEKARERELRGASERPRRTSGVDVKGASEPRAEIDTQDERGREKQKGR